MLVETSKNFVLLLSPPRHQHVCGYCALITLKYQKIMFQIKEFIISKFTIKDMDKTVGEGL